MLPPMEIAAKLAKKKAVENHPELSFDGAAEVVEKLVPPKKAALKELNMKALSLGKNYNK